MSNKKAKAVKLEDLLHNINQPSTHSEKSDDEVKKTEIPRGIPKSGRFWKCERKRASSLVKARGLRLPLEKKLKVKDEIKRIKEMSRSIKEQRQEEKEQKKERRRANLKRRKENETRGEVVQVIKNTAKLRKLKGKHLRMLHKRDTCEDIGKKHVLAKYA